MAIDYQDRIPNNVDLGNDRALQRALEHWQPGFLGWWKEVGPVGTSNYDVYLRTAVSAEPNGWAHFDYVKMPDYRWGIFLAPPQEGRIIPFGDHKGEPAWQEVPGEHREQGPRDPLGHRRLVEAVRRSAQGRDHVGERHVA